MADAEQLRILKKQGVKAWNAWRQRAGDISVGLYAVASGAPCARS